MQNHEVAANLNILRQEMNNAYRRCEHECIAQLLQQPIYSTEELSKIQAHARDLTNNARDASHKNNILQTLLQQYDLSTEQGIALMCLAEALLRIPDQKTRDLLISDKISTVNWIKHANQNNSFFANATSWSLLIAGKIFSPVQHKEQDFITILKQTLVKPGIIVLRPFIKQAIKIIGAQFVKGETIEAALQDQPLGYCFSFDMLGEAARTATAAQQYFAAYTHAINVIGNSSQSHNTDLTQNASISIKLSALHPRYEYSQKNRILTELVPELINLVCLAQKYNIGVTIDAEEADRLELSLDIFAEVFNSPALQSWSGLGIAVQAYQKRAPYVINWLKELAHHAQKRIMVRLVKGAYWDYEIKQTQLLGLSDYPVFTRKQATDLSYLVCAHSLLHNCKYFYPQFATHNIYSISAVLVMASSITQQEGFEFQCLYGMGNPIYDQIVGHTQYQIPVRVYAPVGSHESLVGYLIRRLLENGANNSFVRKLANQQTNIEEMLIDPAVHLSNYLNKSNPYIKLPSEMYPDRANSVGTDLSDPAVLSTIQTELVNAAQDMWVSHPIINGHDIKSNVYYTSLSPVNIEDNLGQVYLPTPEDVEHCLAQAHQGTKLWAATHYLTRAEMLENLATLLQEHQFALVSLLVRESGKTITDALGELREAIDYCYYYATQAKQKLAPQQLVGATGESNVFTVHPRGVIVCISPCNFPLAIFTGQIVAALVTGNVVIAKPAEQTPLIAQQVINLLYQAGIPSYALHLLPGQGSIVGSHLIQDQRVAGVMFTGSTRAAFTINRDLANRPGPIIPFIAETGGQNTMIVDASALCEQVVVDIIQSAFNSSGQRCSALRILFVQRRY